ncbi:hypothetical protein ABZ383_30500 [Streptomyces sp. NPDC005900]|uniref:hypothetical protein n=1 Tax=Streptomyces sp. NPDC005900 TaxID=3154569 RepID=UPI0034020449
MPAPADDFDDIVKDFHMHTPTDTYSPYGSPEQPPAPGLTKRGKVAIAVGAAIIGSGSLLGYQVHSSNAAQAEAKAQEIQLKADALELEKLRELNRASEVNRKVETTAEKARQADINACVKDNANKVGKGLGAPTQRDVVDSCQAQYASTDNGEDMAAAGSSTSAGQGGGVDVNSSMLIGAGAIALIVFTASKGRRNSHEA